MNRQQRRAAGRTRPPTMTIETELQRTQQDRDIWKERYEAMLDVLNAILWAYGEGPQHRLAIGQFALGIAKRDPVNMESNPLTGGVVLYHKPEQAPVTKEDTDAGG